LDGAILTLAIPRRVHIVVGLDWIPNAAARVAMEFLCRAARWPIVLRPKGLPKSGPAGAHDPSERFGYLRRARDEAVDLLARGAVVVVFPEGFPNVDPSFTPKQGEEFLAFDRGFVGLALAAGRRLGAPVPIVPAGFTYRPEPDGWDVVLSFGKPVFCVARKDAARAASEVEAAVRASSLLAR
jgi:putative membrane protein